MIDVKLTNTTFTKIIKEATILQDLPGPSLLIGLDTLSRLDGQPLCYIFACFNVSEQAVVQRLLMCS